MAKGRSAERDPKAIARRFAVWGLWLFVAFWAVQGGEYGTTDLLRQRGRVQAARARVDSLERVVQGLRERKRLVESDPATQERIAREEFGLVREGELLYRFVDP
jgi:cell division protein FtsB